ncbi:MAG TPA: transketolase family protein [candidate division Zixibacteria bacterium]|nr:transketolase family protein [candidate division Zixibacteria bacterium]
MEFKEKKKTREGFGRALEELGEKNPNVVVLVGDLAESTMVHYFAKKFPERFFNMGVAEQNMTNVAAGLSLTGKISFFSTYGAFAACRNLDHVRITICYSNLNVKIGGAHGGISVGPDGATHQAMEEFAIMRSLPNMKLIVPCDFWEAKKATLKAAEIWGPFYIRFGREDVPLITDEARPFVFGKADMHRDGKDLTIIACGVMVAEALSAADILSSQGISARVLNMHTLKPIDKDAITKAAQETGAIVTAEEHQINGGLGSAVSQVVAENHPVPMEYVAVMDRFGMSGKPDELMKVFGIKDVNIVEKALKVIKRKKQGC